MTPDPRGVLVAFGLPGEPTSYAEVGGGWSNRVLRLTTTHGDYAIKELRNAWGEPRWLDWLAEGWRLERAAEDVGLALPAPVAAPDGGCLAWVAAFDGGPDVPVRVHRWVVSSPVPREPVGLDLASWVGRALARVHGLALAPLQPDLYAGRAGLATVEVWPDLVARSAGAPWAHALADAEPLARRASALLRPWDPADAVLVHGDVDQKNLLLGPTGPLLIDWDVVSPLLPSHDLAHAALTMASWERPAIAREVLRGYAAASASEPTVSPTDLGPALASRLGWIRFCVDRALAGDPEAAAGIVAALDDLRHRVEVAEDLPAWLAR